MNKFHLVFFGALLCLLSCEKEETETKYTYQYKLTGIYQRDTAIKTDGTKILDLRADGNYCYTKVINGLDSNFCFGKYIQTSDTSLLWEGGNLVTFKITPIDTLPKGMLLKINGSPPVAPLFGYYQ